MRAVGEPRRKQRVVFALSPVCGCLRLSFKRTNDGTSSGVAGRMSMIEGWVARHGPLRNAEFAKHESGHEFTLAE